LWTDQISDLQLELFDGEELAKEREASLAEEKRLQEEREKQERLAKKAAEKEAAKLKAQQEDREGYLTEEVKRLNGIIAPLEKAIFDA